MRAGRVILIVLLFLWAGCRAEPSRTATVEKQTANEKTRLPHASELDEQLCEAVDRGDIEQVRSLLADGANVNAISTFSSVTPLYLAVESGNLRIAELLIARGADANVRDEGNATPLHEAAAAGRKEMVNLLIAHGANVNAIGGILGATPLCEAVVADYSMLARELLKAERPDLSYNDKLYRELKENLAKQLMLDIVQTLITHGADVNARDEFGGRLLDYVLMDTPVEVVRLLLASGADPGLRGDNGMCVLHTAVAQDRIDLVTLFLDSGTQVDAHDTDRQTPLHEAVWRDNKAMVELLLARGANVNARDRRRDTPLHIAAVNRYTQVFDLLVSKGADVKARNRQRLTPVDYARSRPPRAMIRLTTEGSLPYSVIITSISAIRELLRSRAVAYDQIWIPREADVKRADVILSRPGETGKAKRMAGIHGRETLASDLGGYNREYAGFRRGNAKFVLCRMNQCRPDTKPSENRFSVRIMDDGRAFMFTVIALDAERVERLECDGIGF